MVRFVLAKCKDPDSIGKKVGEKNPMEGWQRPQTAVFCALKHLGTGERPDRAYSILWYPSKNCNLNPDRRTVDSIWAVWAQTLGDISYGQMPQRYP